MLITGIFAGILGLIYLLLSMRVVRARREFDVPFGDGGNDELIRRIRAHSNFAEYVPFVIFLMLLLEVQGLSAAILYVIGSVIVLARIAHATGIVYTKPFLREVGMVVTFGVLGVTSALCIVQYFMPTPFLE